MKLCEENSCRSITLASSGSFGRNFAWETERLGHALGRVDRRPWSK
jgi:hypothetical protein